MTNYYQILGLENFADSKKVHLRYIKLIKQYHPDINSSPDAADFTKILNLIKEELTDPDKKARYDYRLKWSLNPFDPELKSAKNDNQKTKESKVPGWSDLSVTERRKIIKDFQRKRDIQDLETQLKKSPAISKIFFSAAFMLMGFYIYLTNYYISKNGYEAITIMFGFVLFSIGVISFINYYYSTDKLAALKKQDGRKSERKTIIMFLALFSILLSGVPFINTQIKKYYLKNDYDIVKTKKIIIYKYDYEVSYKVNGKRYVRTFNNLHIKKDIFGRNYVCLKYARKNPLMVESIPTENNESCK